MSAWVVVRKRVGGFALPIDRERVSPDLVGHPVAASAHGFPVVGRLREMFGVPRQQLREAGKPRDRGHHYTPITESATAASSLAE